MKLKKHTLFLFLIWVLEMTVSNINCQSIQTKPTRQSSFEAFSQGNYEKAYAEFRELLKTYSKDPLYKYYSGVCLVKLKKDPDEAIDLLQQALQGSGTIKTLPADGYFYLGRAQQMAGKFSEAAGSYNLYTERAGKKAAREMEVPEYLQECTQKKGQVSASESKLAEIPRTSKPDTIKANTKTVAKPPVQTVSGVITADKSKLPSDYEKILGEAVEFQFKADSVTKILNDQKKNLENQSISDKSDLKIRIQENEKRAAAFQSLADQRYREAQLLLNPRQDSIKQAVKPVLPTEYAGRDSSKNKAEASLPVTPVVRPKAEVYSFFEVLANPLNDPKAQIIPGGEVPDGLIYRIQIAVFRNPVQPSFFKGLSPVYGFRITGTDKTIYYAGMFRKSSDAGKALATVKARGFKDAFVVALSDNKTVSADRAAQMEKEWGKKPFMAEEKTATAQDTIPPTLTFRVEVTRSVKPLKEDVIEGIRKMSGNRGLDIDTLEDGKISYLIGKFITFESAAEYADLLKRNGYRDVQVVARLGKKEIPIETAKQLFEKLK